MISLYKLNISRTTNVTSNVMHNHAVTSFPTNVYKGSSVIDHKMITIQTINYVILSFLLIIHIL